VFKRKELETKGKLCLCGKAVDRWEVEGHLV
jgi:hypothetical protein